MQLVALVHFLHPAGQLLSHLDPYFPSGQLEKELQPSFVQFIQAEPKSVQLEQFPELFIYFPLEQGVQLEQDEAVQAAHWDPNLLLQLRHPLDAGY